MYDITLMAAIKALQCGPHNLSITGEWLWLLAEFASTYGIRNSYAVLTHMRWVMRCFLLCHVLRLSDIDFYPAAAIVQAVLNLIFRMRL